MAGERADQTVMMMGVEMAAYWVVWMVDLTAEQPVFL